MIFLAGYSDATGASLEKKKAHWDACSCPESKKGFKTFDTFSKCLRNFGLILENSSLPRFFFLQSLTPENQDESGQSHVVFFHCDFPSKDENLLRTWTRKKSGLFWNYEGFYFERRREDCVASAAAVSSAPSPGQHMHVRCPRFHLVTVLFVFEEVFVIFLSPSDGNEWVFCLWAPCSRSERRKCGENFMICSQEIVAKI